MATTKKKLEKLVNAENMAKKWRNFGKFLVKIDKNGKIWGEMVKIVKIGEFRQILSFFFGFLWEFWHTVWSKVLFVRFGPCKSYQLPWFNI